MREPLSFAAFSHHIQDAADLKSETRLQSWERAARFEEDLNLDSVRVFEIVLTVEELDVELDERLLDSVRTVGALYDAYVAACS